MSANSATTSRKRSPKLALFLLAVFVVCGVAMARAIPGLLHKQDDKPKFDPRLVVSAGLETYHDYWFRSLDVMLASASSRNLDAEDKAISTVTSELDALKAGDYNLAWSYTGPAMRKRCGTVGRYRATILAQYPVLPQYSMSMDMMPMYRAKPTKMVGVQAEFRDRQDEAISGWFVLIPVNGRYVIDSINGYNATGT